MWMVFAAWAVVGLTVDKLGYGRAFFWIFVPALFLALFATVRRAHARRVPNGQAILWGIVVPFLVGLLAAGLWHGAVAALSHLSD
jgi:hypothetical protein